MIFTKKSLGQNFLIDKNVIKKIINLTKIKNKNIIEIGPGKGALTEEILKKKPKSLKIIKKNNQQYEFLKKKYFKNKIIKIFNKDILTFNLEEAVEKNSIIFDYSSPTNLSKALKRAIELSDLDLNCMYQNSLQLSSNYGINEWVIKYELIIRELIYQ